MTSYAASAAASGEPWPPDYTAIFLARDKRLDVLVADPIGAKEYYRTRCHDFIEHFCDTYDPRNAGSEKPTHMPFILFRRQRDMIDFLLACLNGEGAGLIEKCRDAGATWVCCAFSVWLWLYWPGVAVGWGSRKEQLVDKLGDPDSIFEKIRMLIDGLPAPLLPRGFNRKDHMTYMKVINPETGATITGEAGDNIGRGGRKRIYFKDESAHYERPEKIEASLGDNTRCQIDISSVNGLGNVFHRRRESGVEWTPGAEISRTNANVFVMDWRDHPAKTPEWYKEREEKHRAEGLLHIFAQEVDRNYAASVEGVIIKAEWIKSAIDADKVLGFDDSGAWGSAVDVSDGGGDRNAQASRKGVVLKYAEEWGAVDTGVTARRAIDHCRPYGKMHLQYDCIGVGSGVKSEGNRLAQDGLMPDGLMLVPWNAGAKVLDPDERLIPGDKQSPLNKDYFHNFKAQAWWHLARRFERTHRAVTEKISFPPGQLISLPSSLPRLRQIEKELSQATQSPSASLKMVVNKTPEGTKSPNIADAIVMAYFPAPVGALSFTEWI